MTENIVLSHQSINAARMINILNKAEFNLLSKKFRTLNISHVQALVIISISNRNEEIFQKNLEYQFGVSTATMTQSIKSMQKKELLYKIRSNLDGRFFSLHLTEKGKQLYPKCMSIYTEVESIIESSLTEKEKSTFLKVMEKLTSVFNNYQ